MCLVINMNSQYLIGIRYFEKPVAGYWIIAIGQAVFGDNLFGVRIASALSIGLSVVMAYLIARRMWDDPRKSFTSALLYASFAVIAVPAWIGNHDSAFPACVC